MKKIFRSEKRFGAVFLMLLLLTGLLLGSGIHARADVIYEPDDDFYREHASDCTYVNAVYIVNHPNGKATMYVSPENAKVISEFENGERVNVSYSYTDRKGQEWASVTDWRNNGHKDGWIPMDYLYEAYSDRLFYEDYASEIRPAAQGEHSDSAAMTVYFYNYPGSDQYFQVRLDEMGDEPVSALPATMIFTDEEGRNWGRIGYFYGYRDVWYCMDDPEKTAEELYPDGLPVRDTRDIHSIGSAPTAESESHSEEKESRSTESAQETDPESTDAPEPKPIEIRPTVNVAVVLIAAALISLAVAAAVVILIIIVKHTKKKK